MQQSDKIYVADHRGLVGSAIVRALRARGYTNIVGRTRDDTELENQAAVFEFFEAERPAYVFLAAAKVGCIHANATLPADFIRSNLTIQLNVVEAAYRAGVTKLMFLGSPCIYPRLSPQPIPDPRCSPDISSRRISRTPSRKSRASSCGPRTTGNSGRTTSA